MSNNNDNILEVAIRILSEYHLCDNCLGRLFGSLLTGLSNRKRGKLIRELVMMEVHKRILRGEKPPNTLIENIVSCGYDLSSNFRKIFRDLNIKYPGEFKLKCDICGSILSVLNSIADSILDDILRYDFKTFIVGAEAIPEIEIKEDDIKRKYKIWYGESIRSEISRELGKILEVKFRERNLNRYYDPKAPDAVIIIDVIKKHVKIWTRPLRVKLKILNKAGYRTFALVCKKCSGRGCKECVYTGRILGEDIESIVGWKLLEKSRGIRWKYSVRYIDGKNRNLLIAVFRILNPARRITDIDIKEIKEYLKNKGIEVINYEIQPLNK